MKRLLTLLILFSLAVGPLFSQSEGISELPSGYRSFQMGMTMESVKNELLRDPYFRFDGDPDVSMLSRPNQYMIQCRGGGFIQDAVFQFDNDRLFSLSLILDPKRVDHYSVYTRLTDKYGNPDDLNPSRSLWQSDRLILSLERPLTVRYLDRRIFEEILNSGEKEETIKEILREDFLEQF